MDSNFQTPPRQIISSQQEQDSNDPEKTWQTIQSSQSFVPYLTEKSTDRPYNPSSQKNYSRIVCMSDTHGKHRDIDLPKGDILIHGGDFTRSGEKETISDVSRYFGELLEQHKFQQIICIAGNHELTFDDDHYKDVHEHFHSSPMDCSASRNALKNCIYLQDSSCNIHSMEIYGTPWTPCKSTNSAIKIQIYVYSSISNNVCIQQIFKFIITGDSNKLVVMKVEIDGVVFHQLLIY